MRDSKRYLGLELSGAKNQKTALAALEFYPKEKKIFLLDIFERVVPKKKQSSDEALLELIEEVRPGTSMLGVNVPLQLPPCLNCSRRNCGGSAKCDQPAVKWMREITRKAGKNRNPRSPSPRVLDFTSYTQRPVELYVRYLVFPCLPETHRFEIDETLGGNKAPLTARMNYLQRHLRQLDLVEVWPKLSVAVLALELGLSRRTVSVYRHLEQGAHAREEILSSLAEGHGIFIYERDIRKLAVSLTAFDAFICAYTALLADNGRASKPVPGFPVSSGWVQFPHLEMP